MLAIGVFAAAIVAVLGLLPPATRTVASLLDSAIANRLTQNIQAELNRIGFTTAVSLTATPNIRLVASPDGGRVRLLDGTAPANNTLDATLSGIAERDRYFLITLNRQTAVTQTTYVDTRSGSLSLRADVVWPYQIPAGPASTTNDATGGTSDPFTPVPAQQRSSMTVFFGINP